MFILNFQRTQQYYKNKNNYKFYFTSAFSATKQEIKRPNIQRYRAAQAAQCNQTTTLNANSSENLNQPDRYAYQNQIQNKQIT